jgi:hypothetical protein
MTRVIFVLRPIWLLLLLGASQTPAPAAQLQPETIQAFDRQLAAVDQSSKQRLDGRTPFLWATASADRRQRLIEGDLVVAPRQGKGDISVEKGIVHHWIGCVFVPNRHAADALTLLRDFDSYKLIYPGSVVESKAVQRTGDVSRAYLRLRKHRMVTVVLDTEYDVEFSRVDDRRAYSRSLSTRIAQVDNPGTPEEQELPVGDDSGFLWRIVTLWRLEEADGGVYLECEVLALTRGVPYGLGWLIRPIIRSFPRESLAETLNDTRGALLAGSGKAGSPRSLSRVDRANVPVKPIEASLP